MIKLLILNLFIVSCSSSLFDKDDGRVKEFSFAEYNYYSAKDYVDQLSELKKFYLMNKNIFFINISKPAGDYLGNMANSIISKNELFFEQSEKNTKFAIVKNPVPFHFSFPGRHIFLSTGLINKYIKHEGILASIISYELVKSEKLVYNKNIIIPTGYLSTKKIIKLLRIPLDKKIEVHKWGVHSAKKAGFDSDQYLAWIQIQNRNNLDFSFHLGDISNIAREESLFKSFLIDQPTSKKIERKRINSSKSFYQFVKEISRKV